MAQRVHASQIGAKFCKGICSRLASSRGSDPYSTHYYCSRCAYWGNKELLTWDNRCECCNFVPRMKSHHNKHWKENNPDKNKHRI